jgi:hypothetical protein
MATAQFHFDTPQFAAGSFILNGQTLSVEMHIFTGRYAQKNVHLSARKLVSNLFRACPIPFSSSCSKRLFSKRPMAHEQGKMGGFCFTKGLFYLSWFISSRTSFRSVSRPFPPQLQRSGDRPVRDPNAGDVEGRSAMGVPIPMAYFNGFLVVLTSYRV